MPTIYVLRINQTVKKGCDYPCTLTFNFSSTNAVKSNSSIHIVKTSSSTDRSKNRKLISRLFLSYEKFNSFKILAN